MATLATHKLLDQGVHQDLLTSLLLSILEYEYSLTVHDFAMTVEIEKNKIMVLSDLVAEHAEVLLELVTVSINALQTPKVNSLQLFATSCSICHGICQFLLVVVVDPN